MNLITVSDYQALSERAADLVVDRLRNQPDAVFVFPTGNTPVGMFRALARRVQAGEVDFSRARVAELDEYWRIALNDERNLFRWLQRELIEPAGVRHVIRFNSDAEDPRAELERVERALAEWGGIDLLFLGLGPNGHVGFNEPGSPPDAAMHLCRLTPESIISNARYWGGEANVPRHGMTLGLGTLTKARQTVLLVSGETKAGVLARVVEGDVTPAIPATLLRRAPDVTVIADEGAARKLARTSR